MREISAIRRHFGKSCKLMLSKKIKSNENITQTENNKIINTERELRKILNTFFFKYCLKPRYSAIKRG